MSLKIGVIGTGAIGRDHTRRITSALSGGRVVAVTDVNAEAARDTVATYGLDARVHPAGRDVVADPNVEAVVVTSWGPSHEEFVLAAIAAGKPVFCEKPLATTAAGALNVVRAETGFGRRLVQVGFMRRYDAGYRALKAVVQSGEIGAPLLIHCAHRNPDCSPDTTNATLIHETLIHEIDVLRWLLDDDYGTAQVAFGRPSRNANPGVADPLMVFFETARGVRIDAEVFVTCRYGYDIQCEVVCDTGVARLPEPDSVILRKDARLSTGILMDWKDRFIASYDIELQDWIRAASAGGAAGPSAWDGYAAAIAADVCVAALARPGSILPVVMPERPALYGADA